MIDFLACVLAAFRLTRFFVFDGFMEGLRQRIGIIYLYAEEDKEKVFPTDRVGFTRLAKWMNCYSCFSLLFSSGLVLAWYSLAPWRWPLWLLALSGGEILLHRWYMSQRVKAEWWL